MTTYTLPDGTTITRAACLAYRQAREAEGARLEATRAEFLSAEADGLDEKGLRLHARALEIARPDPTEDEYAAALEEAEREGATVRAVADPESEVDQFTARRIRGEALDLIATADGPAKSEAEYLERFAEAERVSGVRYDGRAA